MHRTCRPLAAELFDFEETARRALSRHWAARSRSEQLEFVGLFTDLLERAYLGKIEAYSSSSSSALRDQLEKRVHTVSDRRGS